MLDFGLTPDMLLGKPTLHLPMNFIVQSYPDGKTSGVFQTVSGKPLTFDSKKTHQLILGDVFIRPRLVFESDHLKGAGISGIFTSGFTETDDWIAGGMIFNRENQK